MYIKAIAKDFMLQFCYPYSMICIAYILKSGINYVQQQGQFPPLPPTPSEKS